MEPDDLKPSDGFSRTICAICFEELRPVVEDLQSISLCGHVFHELCLQQWFEYCPSGKKNTCPLCKQQCCQKSVHRLYFQSLGEPTQAPEKSRCFDASPDDVIALRGELKKLGGQLAEVNQAFGQQKQRLKELMIELSVAKDRGAREEALKVEAAKEKTSLQQLLKRKTDELAQSSVECSKAQERSLALAKELAAHKLMLNLDLDEQEITRLTSIGHGTNSEDVIITLRRSLILRNKSYKELLAQCNLLGREGQSSQKKLEKAVKKIEKLKERVKELERTIEDEGNDSLRNLKLNSSKRFRAEGFDEYGVKLCFSDSNNCNLKAKEKSGDVGQQLLSTSSLPSASSDTGFLLPSPSFNVNENGFLPKYQNSSSPKASKREMVHIEVEEPALQTEMATVDYSIIGLGKSKTELKSCMAFQCSKKPEDSNQLSAVETNADMDLSGRTDTRKSVPVELMDLACTNDTNSRSNNQNDASLLITLDDESFIPIVKEKATSHTNSVTHTVDQCFPSGLFGSNIASRPTGKWCRQGQMAPKDPPAVGQLIAVGADGRGGRIKVLRSQNQSFARKQNLFGMRHSKKWAEVTKQNGQAQGCLQIEHFFEKTGS
ncbi:uncharacterized protein LOC116260711 [Nymphaea colorata]|nr:uncharacterized protein LOC116260711 [Nymphaea colorata]